VQRRLRRTAVDLVLSPGSIPVSLLDTSVPVVVWADATVRGMLGYYPSFSNWSRRTLRNALWLERQCFKRVSLFVAASEWARKSALDEGLPVARSLVVPFGANLPPDAGCDNAALVSEREVSVPRRVLFVGVDWHRKGAPVAIEVIGRLVGEGMELALDVVGCEPPAGASIPALVEIHGFLDKGKPEESDRLYSLYKRASILLLPTQAECLGVVFAEAAAFGLPVVAFDTGGVSSAVVQGVTGMLSSPGDVPGLVTGLRLLLTRPEMYEACSRAAIERFKSHLNWDSAVTEVLSVAGRLVGDGASDLPDQSTEAS
jgi:glycosyltransferase involved in cell wall biosynthesis